jgi:hypothetical protein
MTPDRNEYTATFLRGWRQYYYSGVLGCDACGGWVKEQHLRSHNGITDQRSACELQPAGAMRSTTTELL